jgi:hypothetical protein
MKKTSLQDPPKWAIKMVQKHDSLKKESELPRNLPSIDVGTLRVSNRIKRLILRGTKADPKRLPSRSEAIFAVICSLIEARYEDITIASILLNPKNQISEKPLEKGKKWVVEEIVRARNKHRSLQEQQIPGIVHLDSVTAETVTWLWPSFIPLGKITLLDGDPGLGKSSMALDIAARISTNSTMPDGSPSIQGGVVLLTLEDGLADTVVPRLKAMGANLSQIIALESVANHDGKLRIPTIEDIDAIGQATMMVQAKLVVVDPLMAYMGGRVNSWSDQDVRGALGPLAKMAEKMKVAVLVIRHLNKSGGGQAIYRGGGSIGIIGAARSALLVAKDPDDENRRVLAGIKSNLGPLPPSLAFHVESINGTSKIIWEGNSHHSADALLSVPASEEERSALDDAKYFILEVLSSGPVESKIVLRQARSLGISDKTLYRARHVLEIDVKKLGYQGAWMWTLKDGQDSPKMVNKNNDHLWEKKTTFGKKAGPIVEAD